MIPSSTALFVVVGTLCFGNAIDSSVHLVRLVVVWIVVVVGVVTHASCCLGRRGLNEWWSCRTARRRSCPHCGTTTRIMIATTATRTQSPRIGCGTHSKGPRPSNANRRSQKHQIQQHKPSSSSHGYAGLELEEGKQHTPGVLREKQLETQPHKRILEQPKNDLLLMGR